MKIAFIACPYNNISEVFTPHIGMHYVSTYITAKGYYCENYDFSNLPQIEFEETLKNNWFNEYDIVGFPTYDENINKVLWYAEYIKKINPNMKIIFGGPHASSNTKELLELYGFLDFIILGEGELTTFKLLEGILNNENLEKIKGIAYRIGGSFYISSEHNTIEDLDTIPFPKFKSIKNKKYNQYFHLGRPALNIISSRGCPYSCSFCGINNIQKIWRGRTAQNIIEEIEYRKHNDNVDYKHIYFIDALFAISYDRVFNICKSLNEYDRDLTYSFSSRVEFIIKNKHKMDELKKLGVTSIELGIENFSDKILALYNKQISSKDIDESITSLLKTNININLDLILFSPETTYNELCINYKSLKEYNFTNKNYYDALFSTLILFTGTKLREIYSENLGKIYKHNDIIEILPLIKDTRTKLILNNLYLFREKYLNRILIFLEVKNKYNSNWLEQFLLWKLERLPFEFMNMLLIIMKKSSKDEDIFYQAVKLSNTNTIISLIEDIAVNNLYSQEELLLKLIDKKIFKNHID